MDLGTVLLLVAGGLIGVAGFLYNDGHDHEMVSIASAVIAFVASIASGLAQQQHYQDAQYDCAVYHRGCETPSLGDALAALGIGAVLVEVAVLGLCAATGALVARATSKTPSDGRPHRWQPPDPFD
jgi:hypothetical protein